MINVTFFTLLLGSCLIVAVLSFFNGIDRAKVEKEEAERKLRNLAELKRRKI